MRMSENQIVVYRPNDKLAAKLHGKFQIIMSTKMSKIFDNIETKFEEGLHAILTNVGVERADFRVGYFNLRGWKQVAVTYLTK